MYLAGACCPYHLFWMQSADRYIIRRTGGPDQWCVWDRLRDEPVFGAEVVSKDQARDLARRLNDAYRPLDPE